MMTPEEAAAAIGLAAYRLKEMVAPLPESNALWQAVHDYDEAVGDFMRAIDLRDLVREVGTEGLEPS